MAENPSHPGGLQDISRGATTYDINKKSLEEDSRKKELDKVKTQLDDFAKFVTKKYKFVECMGFIPKNFNKQIELDTAVPESESKKDLIHVAVIVSDDKEKEIPKMQVDLINHLKEKKQNVWVHIMSRLMFWELGLDSRFEFMSAISMAYPLYDKTDFLAGIRVAQIHKEFVLQKFGKYISSYILAGSVVTGTASKTSDIDAAIIIDDTDVKRMSRVELKERLRSQIYQFIFEASKYAGVKDNLLNVQVWLLTEFWEGVKDANPVFFTFIRDGVPISDRGSFLPWKLLLKMGKIKPSPEAIDIFMSMGDKLEEKVNKYLLDIVIIDLYWGVVTPSQALFMLYGRAPPAPKLIVGEMKEIFCDKEKMIEKKYIDILDKIVSIYKGFEHGKVKSIKGEEIDKLKSQALAYIEQLKKLRTSIEQRRDENLVRDLHDDVFKLLKGIFGNKNSEELVKEFNEQLVKKGMVSPGIYGTLKDLVELKKDFKKKKPKVQEIERVRRDSSILINSLIEYSQRCELSMLEKNSMRLKYKDGLAEKIAELIVLNNEPYLIKDGIPARVTSHGIANVDGKEFESAIESNKNLKKSNQKFDAQLFNTIRKVIGDFEIVL